LPVTLSDVARRAGVSRSAVSRAFTQGASVSGETRRKVEKAAAELNYTPSALASALSTGRTKLIGLVSNNFRNPAFLQVFDLFTHLLQERGLRPLLVNLSGGMDAPEAVRLLRQYSVDGVIVASSTLPQGFATALREAQIPVVHSFGRGTGEPATHVVGIDNEECGRLAARELLRRGYSRVGFLGGPKSASSSQDRARGFVSEIEGAGAKCALHFAQAYSFEASREEMRRILRDRKEIEAWFCGDDVLSIGAMSALADAGLRVPEDVGVIGVNDMEIAGWNNIALTTIRQPFGEIIRHSVDLLTELMANPQEVPRVRLFPVELVERGTLRPPR
jgi:DNA-binding LacI/PurR family transcriptional regulator